MAHRYYINGPVQGDTALLEGPDAEHLARVMRAKAGDEITLCDGSNTDYTAVVQRVEPARVTLGITARRESAAEPKLQATVYLGYSKGDKLELCIQKAVELGAVHIQPFFCASCVVKPKKEEAKNERYNRIAREAAKQCGRGVLPAVGMPMEYDEMLRGAAQNDVALFLYERGGARLREVLQQTAPHSVAIITGPEGGFTPAEAEAATAAGCTPVGLGPRILRCETAPIAALAAVMALCGELE